MNLAVKLLLRNIPFTPQFLSEHTFVLKDYVFVPFLTKITSHNMCIGLRATYRLLNSEGVCFMGFDNEKTIASCVTGLTSRCLSVGSRLPDGSMVLWSSRPMPCDLNRHRLSLCNPSSTQQAAQLPVNVSSRHRLIRENLPEM